MSKCKEIVGRLHSTSIKWCVIEKALQRLKFASPEEYSAFQTVVPASPAAQRFTRGYSFKLNHEAG